MEKHLLYVVVINTTMLASSTILILSAQHLTYNGSESVVCVHLLDDRNVEQSSVDMPYFVCSIPNS